MKHFIIAFMVAVTAFVGFAPVVSAAPLAETLSGRILLQVEENGEAWYVFPGDLKRYYLGRPDDAFQIMRQLGLGATSDFINGYGYTPYPRHVWGKILLDVQTNGEAYYIYPVSGNAHYLGRPADAFSIMRGLGLGISNADLARIPIAASSNLPVTIIENVYDNPEADIDNINFGY